ncbi:MAG: LysM peptidoglycan-binding domain-containing protein [Oscillospiraceae bacterium]|nr:LysM peptidoglycan-binding domain-containing protein [Oscillospiraceae bacterium]
MFPAREYAFSQSMGMGPYDYVKQFELWALDPSAIVRFIVTETPVNIPVLVESIDYGERDGTGDVYATISLREYRELAVVQTQKAEKTENLSRPDPEPPVTSQTHIVVSGDTLWAIARKYYGDGLLAYHLATYNGIKNANLIYPGQAVNLPDKSLLGAA